MRLCIRKSVEWFKCGLMGHTNSNMEDNGGECDLMNYGCLVQGISEEKNINTWPTGHSCDVLVKYAIFTCPCVKSPPEANMKRF